LPIQRLRSSSSWWVSGGLRSWPWVRSSLRRTRKRLSLSFQARHPGFPFSGFHCALTCVCWF